MKYTLWILAKNLGFAFLLFTAPMAITASGAIASAPVSGNKPAQSPEAQTQLSKTNPKMVPILTLPEVERNQESMDKEIKLEAEGEALFAKRDFEKALVKWQEAYGMSLEMKYSEGEGRTLTNMCRLYTERGLPAKAKQLGENALEVLANVSNKKDLAKARVALAQAYFALDNPMWAGQQLQLALQTFSELGSDDAIESAKLMNLTGTILLKGRKIKEALSAYQTAASYYEQAGKLAYAVNSRITIANALQELGWLVAAKEEANKALDDAKNAKDAEVLSEAQAALGQAQYNLGELTAAQKSFEESIATVSSSDLLTKANIEAGYGHVLAANGEPDQALKHLEKALVVLRSQGSVFSQAQTLNTIGNILMSQGNLKEAIDVFNQAHNMLAILPNKQERLKLVIKQDLATAKARFGSLREAKSDFESCLSLFKNYTDPVLHGRTYTALAEVTFKLKDFIQAETLLKQGISISEKVNDDAALWRDYTLLANIQLSNSLKAEAHDSILSALSYFRSPQAGVFPCPERTEFPSTRDEMGQQLVSSLVSQNLLDPALLAAEQLKEEAFISEWHRRGGEVKPNDRDLYTDLVLQRAHLHAAEATISPDKLLKEWQNWLIRFKQLAADNRALARLIAPVPTTINDVIIQAQRNKATIIDYLLGPQNTIVFILNHTGALSAFTVNVGKGELQEQVATLLATSQSSGATTNYKEKKLLQLLFSELLPAEALSALPDNPEQTIVIIPDGTLFNLPFAALVDSRGKYLVEDHTLTMASSLGVFLDSPPPYSEDMSLVVAEDLGPTKQSTQSETSAISSIFEPELVTKLVGKDTEITNLQEQAKGKAVVHFATSLSLPENNPLSSILPIATDKAAGLITADRLFEMSLPSDLFVWSGTSINTKDVKGNAVKVFSRGLNYAGVRNVLMSLWAEPSEQRTLELIDFYRSKRKGLSQAQSLRRAQLISMSKNPSPKSWAAFQLLGPGH